MASYTFPRFLQFPHKSQRSRTSAILEVAIVSVLSRVDSLRHKVISRGSAHLCNAVLSQTIPIPSFSSSEVALNEFETSGMSDVEEGLWSVVIPTYNRLPILTKCLEALEEQEGYECSGIREYEVVVVDDGSTDGTLEYLYNVVPSGDGLGSSRNGDAATVEASRVFPHVKVVRQEHGGATKARNLGVRQARGAVIVFIDSDLVVTKDFLREHGAALSRAQAEHGDDCTFTYGRVVNTANFENPTLEKFKLTRRALDIHGFYGKFYGSPLKFAIFGLVPPGFSEIAQISLDHNFQDNSAAFFATGNVALSRRLLLKAGNLLTPGSEGPFDADFSEYGWEDLELGVRLKQVGARIQHVALAVGYHWHPAFSMDQIPKLIDQERQRGRNGVRFFLKHPSLEVRLMTQLTPFHEGVWFLLTLGGLINETTLSPILRMLVTAGHPGVAAGVLSPTLNWHTVQASKQEVMRLKQQQGKSVKRD